MRAIITDNVGEKITIATTECTFSLIHLSKLSGDKLASVCVLNQAEAIKTRNHLNEWIEKLIDKEG